MPETIALTAEHRAAVGKGAARATRRAGRVPGIVYGGGGEPVAISLEPQELARALARRGFFATLVDLAIDGAVERTLPREVQYHPVTDRALHIDFMRVSPTSRVTVNVPVVFVDQEQSIGLRRGGILNIVRHGIDVICPVDAIPDHVTVSLGGLDIGGSVHIGAVTLPEGCTPTIRGRDFTIASIAASSAVREEAATSAAAPAIAETAPTP